VTVLLTTFFFLEGFLHHLGKNPFHKASPFMSPMNGSPCPTEAFPIFSAIFPISFISICIPLRLPFPLEVNILLTPLFYDLFSLKCYPLHSCFPVFTCPLFFVQRLSFLEFTFRAPPSFLDAALFCMPPSALPFCSKSL